MTAVRASRWIGWRPISVPLRELLEQSEDMLVQHLALGAHTSLDVSQAARRQAVWLARVGRLLGRRVVAAGSLDGGGGTSRFRGYRAIESSKQMRHSGSKVLPRSGLIYIAIGPKSSRRYGYLILEIVPKDQLE